MSSRIPTTQTQQTTTQKNKPPSFKQTIKDFFTTISEYLYTDETPSLTLADKSVRKMQKSFLEALGEDFFGIDNSLEKERKIVAILDDWILEGPKSEQTARVAAKKAIISFLQNESAVKLDLKRLLITSLPDIWEYPICLERLHELNLSGNQLQTIPDSIGLLTALSTLDLSFNQLEAIPDSIKQQPRLTIIKGPEENFFGIDHCIEKNKDMVNEEILTTVGLWIEEEIESKKPSRIYFKNKVERFLYDENAKILQLADAALSSIPDIWSYPVFAERLKGLDLSGNLLKSLPESIGHLRALQDLRLHNNRIESLPESIGKLSNLTELRLATNLLQSLPESIGQLTVLRVLSLTHNLIRIFPDSISRLLLLKSLLLNQNEIENLPDSIRDLTSLTSLYLAENRLQTLPSSIGELRNLTHLHLHFNHLQALPGSIGQLGALTSLTLYNNPSLSSLPMEILQLSSSCTVNIERCGLSRQIINRLQETCNTQRYRGPLIGFSMEREEVRTSHTPSINEQLDFLYRIANKPRVLFSLEFTSSSQLKNWLSRISYIADFREKSGQKRAILAQKILDFLELAAHPEHKRFHDFFFAIVENATKSCGDSMSLSLLYLGLARRFALLQSEDLQGLATLLLKGTWALSQLEEFARNKIKSLRFVDEIEVYLGYPIKLKERLGLPIDVDLMLYFACSGLTEEDLCIAEASVREHWNNPEKTCAFLASQDLWVEALTTLGLLHEAIARKNLGAENAQTDREYESIRQAYQAEIQAITSHLLCNKVEGLIKPAALST